LTLSHTFLLKLSPYSLDCLLFILVFFVRGIIEFLSVSSKHFVLIAVFCLFLYQKNGCVFVDTFCWSYSLTWSKISSSCM
jgi:hypothetical protein